MACVTRQTSAIFRSSASRFASRVVPAGADDDAADAKWAPAALDSAAAAAADSDDDAPPDAADNNDDDDDDDAAVVDDGGAGRLDEEWIKGKFARNGDELAALASRA